MDHSIVFSHVNKAYGKTVVVEDLNLEIRRGERLILLGPSGCGKTTTLRMIAGFEEITGGELYMDGKVVNDIPPGERNIAMVFQSYALFPHLSVWDNITFGLVLQKLPKEEIEKLKKSALTVSRFIRLMPNLPATVGEAMIAMCGDEDISAEEKATVKALLAKAGTVEEVPEKLMDCVTGISGSGPAYGFMFIEALADAAVKLGMPRNQAYIYAAQTLKGAAAMVLETKQHPASLKDGVCSPGGTTIAAVEKLEELEILVHPGKSKNKIPRVWPGG